jgi:hypothetical protein
MAPPFVTGARPIRMLLGRRQHLLHPQHPVFTRLRSVWLRSLEFA